jgi:hypothetical protein
VRRTPFRVLALVEELGAGVRPRMVGANRQAPLACESVSIRPAEIAVIFEKMLLPVGECPDVEDSVRSHSHTVRRGSVSDGGDNKLSGILETNEAAIREVVHCRC